MKLMTCDIWQVLANFISCRITRLKGNAPQTALEIPNTHQLTHLLFSLPLLFSPLPPSLPPSLFPSSTVLTKHHWYRICSQLLQTHQLSAGEPLDTREEKIKEYFTTKQTGKLTPHYKGEFQDMVAEVLSCSFDPFPNLPVIELQCFGRCPPEVNQ